MQADFDRLVKWHKSLYTSRRKNRGRIAYWQKRYLHPRLLLDQVELMFVLSEYMCNDLYMSFVSSKASMFYEWYKDMIHQYEKISMPDKEYDFEDQDELNMFDIKEEKGDDLDYMAFHTFMNNTRNKIYHFMYQEHFQGYDDFDEWTRNVQGLCTEKEAFEIQRKYRTMQEHAFIQAFYYIQFEAFMFFYRSRHERIRERAQKGLRACEINLYNAIQHIPQYVEALYHFKQELSTFTIDLDRFCHLKTTGYMQIMKQDEHIDKAIQSLRERYSKEYLNVPLF